MNDATPTGISGSDARRATARASPARSASASPGSRWPSIERETSITTNASASVRARARQRLAPATGCAAATPREAPPTMTATTATTASASRRLGEAERRRARGSPRRRTSRSAASGTKHAQRDSAHVGVRKTRHAGHQYPLPGLAGAGAPRALASGGRVRDRRRPRWLHAAASLAARARGWPSPRRSSGSRSIARWKFAIGARQERCLARCVSVTSRASPMTPSRLAARDRRARSASHRAPRWPRAAPCASFRLIASRGSEVGRRSQSSCASAQRPQRLAERDVVADPEHARRQPNGARASGVPERASSGSAR